MPYLWLTGWQHPDHNTLWRFYKEHRIEMRHLFKLTVRTAVNMDLMDMAVQAIFFFSPAVVSLVGYTNLLAY
jgi:hypothetical protein